MTVNRPGRGQGSAFLGGRHFPAQVREDHGGGGGVHGRAASRVWAGRRQVPPSEKLNIAGIGVGGQGAGDIQNVSSENIVALCDVDRRQAAETFKKFPNAKQYSDFRVMLEKEKRTSMPSWWRRRTMSMPSRP